MQAPAHTQTIGTLGGTMLTIIVNLNAEDIIKTCVLAALGAIVSFVVSVFLKRLFNEKTRK